MTQSDVPGRARLRFRQENRLKRRAEFQETYSQGKCFRRRSIHIFMLPRENMLLPSRIGFTATRKTGSAVVRNLLKRQGREIFRERLPNLKSGYTMVVNFTRSAPETDFVELRRQMLSIWREAGLYIDDTPVRPSDPLGETRAAGEVDAENHG